MSTRHFQIRGDRLDPAHIANASDAAMSQLVNANLARILPEGKVGPDLATPSISHDRGTYTFAIDSNARFSNGHVVAAALYIRAQHLALSQGVLITIANDVSNQVIG